MDETKPTIESLAQKVNQLQGRINTLWMNPNAFPMYTPDPDANNPFGWNRGFISFHTARAAERIPAPTSDGIDAFALKPGFYQISNLKLAKNVPDEAIGQGLLEVAATYAVENDQLGHLTLWDLKTHKTFHAWKSVYTNKQYIWDRIDKKQNFGGPIASSGSYYSLIRTLSTTLLYCYFNLNVNVPKHGYINVATRFPGSLRPSLPVYFTGIGNGENMWGSVAIVLTQDGTIKIINTSDYDVSQVYGTGTYSYDEDQNTSLK
ncbi:hypothetical protein BIS21_14090 [Lactiplantibacillus plantarum]|uniref:hypothetical protein n=1 Tax=Lactiplantibacillus plantarum TaxID=1590 RepID=UPI000C17BF11|nr:hypothetical protein [Lactiplantibacillus plantarum]PKX51455.1 hypothetical protein BIS21_14090 [Lactiplantibacillus plantarum]